MRNTFPEMLTQFLIEYLHCSNPIKPFPKEKSYDFKIDLTSLNLFYIVVYMGNVHAHHTHVKQYHIKIFKFTQNIKL